MLPIIPELGNNKLLLLSIIRLNIIVYLPFLQSYISSVLPNQKFFLYVMVIFNTIQVLSEFLKNFSSSKLIQEIIIYLLAIQDVYHFQKPYSVLLGFSGGKQCIYKYYINLDSPRDYESLQNLMDLASCSQNRTKFFLLESQSILNLVVINYSLYILIFLFIFFNFLIFHQQFIIQNMRVAHDSYFKAMYKTTKLHDGKERKKKKRRIYIM